MVEAALAHKTPDAVQAAYRRTTYLGTKEQLGARVKLMNAWELYRTGEAAEIEQVSQMPWPFRTGAMVQ